MVINWLSLSLFSRDLLFDWLNSVNSFLWLVINFVVFVNNWLILTTTLLQITFIDHPWDVVYFLFVKSSCAWTVWNFKVIRCHLLFIVRRNFHIRVNLIHLHWMNLDDWIWSIWCRRFAIHLLNRAGQTSRVTIGLRWNNYRSLLALPFRVEQVVGLARSWRTFKVVVLCIVVFLLD